MPKIVVNISKEDYDELNNYTSFANTHSGRILKAVKEGTVINTDKYVAVDDIVKRYLFHAEDRASQEISQILYEVKKYDEDDIREGNQ